MKSCFMFAFASACLLSLVAPAWAAEETIVYPGGEGPGKGKHIVLVSGDEEYRSEEACPQLGKILSMRHGFKCTVLFPIDEATGEINPDKSHIPGLEALKTADLLVIFTRFRNLPDDQMKFIVDYVEAGKPVVGLRTATHAFNIPGGKTYSKYHWGNGDKTYEKGFGKQVLGETWVSHWGNHGSESTRGLIAKGQEQHPILRGIKDGDIWGPTDVYEANPAGDSVNLVMGQVLAGMKPDSVPVTGKKNDQMMPVAWVKSYTGEAGKPARVFTTTMGAATDLESEGTRRMIINACLWACGLDDKIGEKTNVEIVGEFKPTKFGFGGFIKGVKPSAHAMK